MRRRNLLILVEKELIEASRNRLILGFGSVFFLLAAAMSLLGFLSPGATDVQLSRVGVSLLNLAILLVPLIGLVIGSQGFAGEFEDGTMELLLTQPVELRDICLGRVLGQWVAVAAALLAGFGASGLILVLVSADQQLLPFLVNLVISLILAFVFLTLGSVISLKAKNRMMALLGALGVWFLAVILYDATVTQLLMALSGFPIMLVLYGFLALNPADLLRVLAIRLSGVNLLFGPATEAMAALPGFKGPLLSLLTIVLWSFGGYVAMLRGLRHRIFPPARRRVKDAGGKSFQTIPDERSVN
ncbi:ABC-2 family transporter protein [Acididesulfobacillus acetoxydans]|uniref:ABC-2 family transporter protein n=1 Tax=Acididesulfobacillus acetoxydans TaxID=1561005 RepID=A0A8S0XAL4_9FIRM|nr:ABC transporter permease subunit [Acididesulfobacillus acetoxydans]CAA7600066.1 ABC-2 family transporter protein [Acididesulfobacillus acetoxydans]CEJ07841.1 ABC-2 family transporter protein [Acididesulfobacillus acetoxydans]